MFQLAFPCFPSSSSSEGGTAHGDVVSPGGGLGSAPSLAELNFERRREHDSGAPLFTSPSLLWQSPYQERRASAPSPAGTRGAAARPRAGDVAQDQPAHSAFPPVLPGQVQGTVRSAGANDQPDLASCLLIENSSGLASSLLGGCNCRLLAGAEASRHRAFGHVA